ncbi:methyl-accepting chemotaxis protein [Clostridium sp.]|uniref:methyl-accepting chemotaxis protein n=1 Tax=Clostridium sp. TaxID=1506 RepID=UPI0026086610|nr:methyl-accepting chemotaxis protein [Clostridium sp.]
MNNKNIKEQLEDFSATIQETSASTEEISASLESIKERVNLATMSAETNTTTLDKFNNEILELQNEIQSFVDAFDNINKITEIIKNISNQTNILGLNAAIEAGRAGDVGRGFSVVANEMRKLADQSKQNTENIKQIINKNNKLISNINNNISSISKKSNELLESNKARVDNINEININMGDVVIGVEQIAKATQEQANEISTIFQEIE